MDKEIKVTPLQVGKIQPPIQPRTITLPEQQGLVPLPPIQQKGFRKRTKTFPKFGISGKQAQIAMCLADGQTLASHSKKNLERHFIWVQNNYIESEKGQSDLRLTIGRYEKKYGKLQESEKEKTGKKQPKKK